MQGKATPGLARLLGSGIFAGGSGVWIYVNAQASCIATAFLGLQSSLCSSSTLGCIRLW